MELKLNDVYKFRYNEIWQEKIFMSSHCFDGQLVVRQRRNGELYLEDTYWSSHDSSNRNFTLEKALEQGTLTLICNYDDVEKCERYKFDYYANEDVFNLSTQHMCYGEYYKRKGAERSPAKMEAVLNDKIMNCEDQIRYYNNDMIYLKEKLEKLQGGDINIYI